MSDNGTVEARPPSQQQKLAAARTNIVKTYLKAVSEPHHLLPDRDERLASVERRLDTVRDSIEKLELLQERLELTGQVETAVPSQLLQQFVSIAAEWAEANGITYGAFQQMGVPPVVLRAAGMSAKGARPPTRVVQTLPGVTAAGRSGGSRHSTTPLVRRVALQKQVARLIPDLVSRLAVSEAVGCSEQTVIRIIAALVEKGWIRQDVVDENKLGGGRRYAYELLVDLDQIPDD